MEVRSALLCDFATIREGLLHVLGGGLTRLWRPELPAPIGVALAVLIDLEPHETGIPHELTIHIFDPDDEKLAEAVAGFESRNERPEPGEHGMAPIVINMHSASTNRYGRHAIALDLDGRRGPVLEFWILHPEEQLIPPVPPAE